MVLCLAIMCPLRPACGLVGFPAQVEAARAAAVARPRKCAACAVAAALCDGAAGAVAAAAAAFAALAAAAPPNSALPAASAAGLGLALAAVADPSRAFDDDATARNAGPRAEPGRTAYDALAAVTWRFWELVVPPENPASSRYALFDARGAERDALSARRLGLAAAAVGTMGLAAAKWRGGDREKLAAAAVAARAREPTARSGRTLRDLSPRNSHVAAAASPRLVSTE